MAYKNPYSTSGGLPPFWGSGLPGILRTFEVITDPRRHTVQRGRTRAIGTIDGGEESGTLLLIPGGLGFHAVHKIATHL